MTEGDAALTVKELVLRLESKIDGYIAAHEQRHAADAMADAAARGDPAQTPAGRVITNQLSSLAIDVDRLNLTVASHERTIQRIVGALLLVSALGIGTLVLLILRIAGLLGE